MTLEYLPKAIKDLLTSLMRKNGYQDASLNVSPITRGETGSSCGINIEQIGRPPWRIFVKFLCSCRGDFTSEAKTYFNNEVIFYGEILKQFRHETLTCITRCYGVGTGDEPFIMMEELEGFNPLKVGKPLSVDLSALILEELGRFHAQSFATRCTEATSKLKETLFIDRHRRIFVHSMHDAYALLRRSLPEDSVYVSTFADFLLIIFNELSDLWQTEDDYKVVTHGDLWPSNILWNSADNTIKFVDFQACRYSSPVHDLMLLLLTGLDKVQRDEHREDLIRRYHASLCVRLKELGVDPLITFPFSALQEQIFKHTRFAMAVAIVGLPLFYNERSVSISNNENTDVVCEFFKNIIKDKSFKCKSKMLEIIMECIDLGYL